MHIDILTIFPEMFDGPFSHSIIRRAKDKGIVSIELHDIRTYSINKHRRVDDYQYGGGSGMVMMIDPIARCIRKLSDKRKYDEVIYMTPDGETLEQSMANTLSTYENILILCGHYKGIDERIRELFITREISIGDYVLSGGELGAAVLCDTIIRLIPGVLNDETSALSDSFQNNLLSPPVYTRPSDFEGHKVPDILLSGNDKAIDNWRADQAEIRTRQRRPDLHEEGEQE